MSGILKIEIGFEKNFLETRLYWDTVGFPM